VINAIFVGKRSPFREPLYRRMTGHRMLSSIQFDGTRRSTTSDALGRVPCDHCRLGKVSNKKANQPWAYRLICRSSGKGGYARPSIAVGECQAIAAQASFLLGGA
jgi:hypothetical protein